MPFTSDRSPRFSGTIESQRTRKPIDKAEVWIQGDQKHKAFTDSRGNFVLEPQKNFHILFYANPSWGFGLPLGTRSKILIATAQGFSPLTIDFSHIPTSREFIIEHKMKGNSLGPFFHEDFALKLLLLKPR